MRALIIAPYVRDKLVVRRKDLVLSNCTFTECLFVASLVACKIKTISTPVYSSATEALKLAFKVID